MACWPLDLPNGPLVSSGDIHLLYVYCIICIICINIWYQLMLFVFFLVLFFHTDFTDYTFNIWIHVLHVCQYVPFMFTFSSPIFSDFCGSKWRLCLCMPLAGFLCHSRVLRWTFTKAPSQAKSRHGDTDSPSLCRQTHLRHLIIAFYLTALVGCGGNAGSQAASLILQASEQFFLRMTTEHEDFLSMHGGEETS